MSRRQVKTRNLGSQLQADDSVNRMASLLLDSPELGHPDGLASHPSAYLDLSDAPEQRQDVTVQHGAALRKSPSRERGRRPSPVIPRKSSLRRHNNRRKAQLSHVDKANMSKLIPKSKTGVLDIQPPTLQSRRKSGEPAARFPISRTVPLNIRRDDAVDNDDVTQKLQDMLAATDALKPQANKQDSRVSRMSHKLANKASRAWDRLQGKKATSENIMRRKISAPLELGGGSELQGGSWAVHRRGIVGDLESAKVATEDGIYAHEPEQSPVNRSITGNSCPDHSTPPSPKTPIRQTDGADAAAVTPTNPFDSDPDFSLDLKTVLTDRPLGASTPRIRRKKGSASLFNTSGLGQQSVQGRVLGKNTPVLARPDAGNNGDYDRMFTDATRPASPRYTSSKKYPSPDKESLAQLAYQLRQMGIQGPGPRRDQRDEMSHSMGAHRPSPHTLAPRDKNLPLKRLDSKPEISVCTPSSLRKSRIPRPAGSTRSEARFGLITHPADPGAMELDELA